MITLYHAPRSRSSRIIWLLEELGAPYQIKTVAIRRRNPAGGLIGAPDPANIHPHGKVPAIVDDGVTVFESAAVVLYLTDAFPQNRIGRPIGDPQRGPYLTWLAYYAGVMEPAFTSAFLQLDVSSLPVAWAPVPAVLEQLNAALGKTPYLLGDTFSGADILIGSTFIFFLGSPLLPRTDLLASYVERLTTRPAYQRAAAKDGG